jgi:2-keto-4-pentenoate hydratase/2-oxohepta-3-ene-1,7-dioic acid hydratase in catechol pathway
MKLATLHGSAVLISADGTRAAHVGRSMREVLAHPSILEEVSWEHAVVFDVDDLDAPVPDPRQVFAIGLNYAPHAAEAGYTAPDVPMVFTKFPTCITGPTTEVRLPDGNVDWEVEIVAVVGRGGRAIPEARAWAAIAGLTLGQDLSERLTQLAGRPAQFSLGKSFAGFGPTGPWIVTLEELPDANDVVFSSTLDGVPLQSGRTADMIFSIPQLVSHLSMAVELLPGDLIFTGTPAGVGNRLDPPRFLRAGETLVSTAEGIGSITQRFL